MEQQVIVHSHHIAPIAFFGFQLLCLATALGVMRVLVKLSWVKSLWISLGITFICHIIFLRFAAEGGPVHAKISFFMYSPAFVIAVIMSIRGIIRFFGDMDDGGNVNSVERQRALEMVQEGKISAEEGAELLDALGRSNAMLGQDKFSRLDILILAGVAIVVLGFFLPWVYIGRGMYQSGQHFKAEGWIVLIITVLAAIPVFVTPKGLLYKMSMLQIFLLLLDSALVISLLFRVGSRMGAGLPVCLLGLVLALVACFAKFKKLAA